MINLRAALMLLLLLEEQSCTYAKIVSLPHQLYVLEGDSGTIRCQNRSMDEQTFYSYVSYAIWWRRDTDGTITRIGSSGSVYSDSHTLNFNPISSENQGHYYCCLPDQSICSNISVVTQSKPPCIKAFNSNYTAVVGSQVTLECNITALGVPTATFGWDKNGHAISHDVTISSNSLLALTLMNVTMEDAGVYTCVARSRVAYRNDHIELNVTQPILDEHMNVINESSNEAIVRVLAESLRTTCQIFEISLATQLERYIHENYNHNVTVNITEILCNEDKSVVICDLQFVGPSATNALEAFVNDLSNSSNSIDFVIFRLRLCHQNCQESNVTSGEEPIDENQNKENILGKNVATVILILVIIFASVLIVFSLMACYLRCRKKRTNIVCLPMQKCVINNKHPTPKHSDNPTYNTLTVSQDGYSTSSSISPGHYNTLQFNYNTESTSPSKFPITTHEDLSSVCFVYPSDDNQNHNGNCFTDSSNFQNHSDHSITSLSHSATNDAMLQANGYVLPDDFGKHSNMSTAGRNFAIESKTKTTLKGTHKAAVILKPDGTGIVQTGTLQAVIPRLGNDEDYTVTPSQTHDSYFDVVKNA